MNEPTTDEWATRWSTDGVILLQKSTRTLNIVDCWSVLAALWPAMNSKYIVHSYTHKESESEWWIMQIGCLPDREETRDRGKTCEAQTSSTGLQIRPKCPGCDRPCGKKHQPEEADTDSSLDLVKKSNPSNQNTRNFFFFFWIYVSKKSYLIQN